MKLIAKRYNNAVQTWKKNNPKPKDAPKDVYNRRAFEYGWEGMNISDVNFAATITFTMQAIKRKNGSKISKKVFRHAAQSCGFMPPGSCRMYF